MNSSELNLDALKDLINVIENSEKTPEVLAWMEEISDSSFGLIDSLILTFLDEMETNLKGSNSILRALTKLFEYIPNTILPQLKSHFKFPLALSKYLTTTKLQDLEGGGFLLLVEIFSSKGFKDVANDEFIKALLDSLAFIQDEKIYLSIVNILMSVSNESPNPEDDLILKHSFSHSNQRFFAEYIVHSLNKALKEQIMKILEFLIRVFLYQEIKKFGSGFFYTNDFHVLCDVLIRDLENTNEEEVRAKELECLEVLLKTEQYKKEGYRKKEFFELLEELTQSDVSEKSKKNAKKILEAKLVQ